MTNQRTKTTDLLFVISTALLTGMFWRMRGDHGWGGFAGMALVAIGLCLSIYAYLPYRNKMTFELFPFVIFLTAITNEGWGTLNSQITGFLEAYATDAVTEISPLAGVGIMLLLGFGWMPFFGAALGFFFSDKKWKLPSVLIMIASFYAMTYFAKATVSHLIAGAVFPESAKAFETALAGEQIDMTAFKAYLSHFNNINWAKKIAFGRNYFQTVEVISQALGSLTVCAVIAAVIKDRKAALIQFMTSLSCAAAITIADVFLFISGGGFRNSLTPPACLSGWSQWEYFTGFFLGLFVAVIAVIAAGKRPAEAIVIKRITPNVKPLRVFVNFGLTFCFPVITAFIIPLANRITDETDVIFSFITFKDEDALMIPLAVIAALALFIPAWKFSKNEKSMPENTFFKAAPLMLFGAASAASILYFCFGNAYLLNGSTSDISIVMYVSAVLFFLCYAALSKKIYFSAANKDR